MKTLAEARVAEEIRRRLRSLTAEDEGRWGVMTADEAVCHLRKAFTMALEDDHLPEGRRPLPPAGVEASGIASASAMAEGDADGAWASTRGFADGQLFGEQTELFHVLERFLGDGVKGTNHPVFGPMSKWDWMRWGYLHTDHHLRQFGR